MDTAFGSSFELGVGASVPANGWVPKLAAAASRTIMVVAQSGATAPDQSPLIYSTAPASGERYFVNLGPNDHRLNGTDPDKLAAFKNIITAMCARLGTVSHPNGFDSGITYSGSWSATAVYGQGKCSNTFGDTATFNASGTAIYIGAIAQSSAPGVAEIRVDGVLKATWSTAQQVMGSLTGVNYCASGLRIGGLSPGMHTVEIKLVSPTAILNKFYLEWFAGSDQISKPDVYLANVTRATAAGYVAAGGSDAAVQLYCDAIAAVAADLATDGLAVQLVDIHTGFDPATMTDVGGFHPNDTGYAMIEAAELATAPGVVVPPPPPVYVIAQVVVDAGGVFYAQKVDGTGLKQISS